MNISPRLVLIIAALVTLSSFAAIGSTGISHASPLPYNPTDSWTGTINVTSSGAIDYSSSGTGVHVLSESSSNLYTLSGVVHGIINFMRNNSVLNGNGYTIYNSNVLGVFSLNISNTNNVKVENLNVNTSDQAGLYVSNSSYDSFSDLNISSAFISLDLGPNTDHITISSSNFSNNPHSPYNYSIIDTGLEPTNTGALNVKSTSFITFTNDNVFVNNTGNYFFSAVNISSNHTNIYGLHVYGKSPFGVLLNSSNILFTNSSIIGSYSYALLSGYGLMPIFNVTISNSIFNISIEGQYYDVTAISLDFSETNLHNNQIYMNETAQTIYKYVDIIALFAYSSPVQFDNNTVLLNSIYANNTGAGGISALIETNCNLTASGNYFEINQASNNTFSSAIGTYRGNITLIKNQFQLKNMYTGVSFGGTKNVASGNEIVDTGVDQFTAFYTSGAANVDVLQNSISINTTNNAYAISSFGGNVTFSGNAVSAASKGIANGVISHASTNGYLNVTQNTFSLGKSYQQYGIITYSKLSYDPQNISQNNIYLNDGSNVLAGIGLNSANHSMVSGNLIEGTSGLHPNPFEGITVSSFDHSSIVNNIVMGNNSNIPETMGLWLQDMHNSSVDNNSVTEFNTSLKAYNSNNDNFIGNYFNNSYDAMNLNTTNYSIFYHNDFMNYRDSNFNISGSSHDQFNATLPLGGNYWQSYRGSDGNGDGIGDSPFTVNGTFVDHYPLMKSWTRPQAVFHAPSSINGTTWKVTFNGQTLQSTGDTIVFNILNGTYQNYKFEYYNTTLYYTNTLNGSFSYNGSDLFLNVPYLHYSYITGKLNLTNFTIYINGKPIATTNGAFNLTVTAGNYTVVIEATGYATFNHTYDLTPGETLLVNPNFAKTPSGGFPQIYEYVAAIVAAAAILGAIVAIYMRGKHKK